MKPDFIGLGVQKCATAWLYTILSKHPQISMAWPEGRDKDTKFFSCFYDRGFEWYEALFHDCSGEVIGEYSTSYFYHVESPERIYDYSPEMKLVVSLRHPVERAFSNHKHEIRLGRVSGENTVFENGLKNNPMYLYQSLYYTHLSRWLKYFPREQLFIIIVDDLKDDSKKIVQQLYRFLNVSYENIPLIHNQRIHETHIPKNKALERLTTGIIKCFRQIGLGELLDFLKSKGLKKILDKVNTKKEQDVFPPMKKETRASLLKYFTEENEKLSALINRDLTAWGR